MIDRERPHSRGRHRGTAIVAGTLLARLYARLARLFAWQGKVFDLFGPDRQVGVLINKITPFSLTFVVAKVYRDKSWMDGRETIIIDYSKTSFFCRKIRDDGSAPSKYAPGRRKKLNRRLASTSRSPYATSTAWECPAAPPAGSRPSFARA